MTRFKILCLHCKHSNIWSHRDHWICGAKLKCPHSLSRMETIKALVFVYFHRYRPVLKLNLDLDFVVDGKAAAFARRECREVWEGWLQSISSPCGGLWWKAMLKGAQTDYGDSQHCTNNSQPCSCIEEAHTNTSYKEWEHTIGVFVCDIYVTHSLMSF